MNLLFTKNKYKTHIKNNVRVHLKILLEKKKCTNNNLVARL